MSDRKSQDPRLSSRGKAAREARRERLAEALRDNLRRRKAQARGRAGPARDDPADEAGGPGGKA